MITEETTRSAMAHSHGMTDLGHLPKRIRGIANFWGGATAGSTALYELAHRDGLTQSVEKLRSEMGRIHDIKVRDELLSWLKTCEH